ASIEHRRIIRCSKNTRAVGMQYSIRSSRSLRRSRKMKSPSLRRGARIALVTLGSTLSSLPMLAQGAPAAGTPITGPQMIDAFEGTFGVHPGPRRNHIKGTGAAGQFVGTAEAAALSRSALFSGKPVPVVARFSLGGGNPDVPDAAPAPRGLGMEFHLPDGALQH